MIKGTAPGRFKSDDNKPFGLLDISIRKDVYTFDREDGMSWAAPYIAGLGALAFQIHSHLKPDDIRKYLTETVTRTATGPVVNPVKFIEKVKALEH